jgi:cytochrome c peroxidase
MACLRRWKEVVDYYDHPSRFVTDPVNRDSSLGKQLHLTAQEKADLVAFLKTLTDKAYLQVTKQ